MASLPLFKGPPFDGMDLETVSLIIQMQLAEVDERESGFRAAAPPGRNPVAQEIESAFSQQKAQLQQQRRDLQAQIAASRTQSTPITQCSAPEVTAPAYQPSPERASQCTTIASRVTPSASKSSSDRVSETAQRSIADLPERTVTSPVLDVAKATAKTSGTPFEVSTPAPAAAPEPPQAQNLTKASTTSANSVPDIQGSPGSSSSKRFVPPMPTEGMPNECIICGDPLTADEALTVTCGHKFCMDSKCLQETVNYGLNSKIKFPPSCCGKPIDLAEFRDYLTRETFEMYDTKVLEYADPDPTFCASCATYLRKEDKVADLATCPKCSKVTCLTCKGTSHGTGACPEDKGAKEVAELAGLNGWKQCKCGNYIARSTGCNEMTSVSLSLFWDYY